MKLPYIFYVLPSYARAFPTGSATTITQEPLQVNDAFNIGPALAEAEKIAIIGSGITGASAAYTLAENARQNPNVLPPTITIFEQNPIIGGRITTTQVFDQVELTIDTCAATFNGATDTCLAQLAQDVGLATTPIGDLDGGTAIWNGESFVGSVEDKGFRDQGLWPTFKKLRLEQRYGTLGNARRSMAETDYTITGMTGMFRSFSEAVLAINESLVRGACEGRGSFCTPDGVSDLYLREVIEAGVRDRFFGDYDELNEINSVLGLASSNTLQSIDGGNLRLLDRLFRLSGARILLGSKVDDLTLVNDTLWDVKYTTNTSQSVERFDKVIIAAPMSLANITVLPASNKPIIPLIDYADTVVTHFTTNGTLSASYFNTTIPVPQTILTSATANKAGNKIPLPFFSLRLLDSAISRNNPVEPGSYQPQPQPPTLLAEQAQNLYKIVSSLPISDDQIAQFLDLNDTSAVVTWIHRENLPNSVPRLNRSLKIQDEIEIRPGLFYAGNGAQVADTVEFGCRMGTNAGRLIVGMPQRRAPGNG